MPREIKIRVESGFVPESAMVCHDKPAIQRQIDYRTTLQGKRFLIPGVWASVCQVNPREDVGFEPSVWNSIDRQIWKHTKPKKVKRE